MNLIRVGNTIEVVMPNGEVAKGTVRGIKKCSSKTTTCFEVDACYESMLSDSIRLEIDYDGYVEPVKGTRVRKK